ncbi:hypothetical protein FRC18_004934, partial [Serendipita sp. 400]
ALVWILECILVSKTTLRQDILCIFRLFSECLLLIDFSMHTDTTLSMLRAALSSIAPPEKVHRPRLMLAVLIVD